MVEICLIDLNEIRMVLYVCFSCDEVVAVEHPWDGQGEFLDASSEERIQVKSPASDVSIGIRI